MNTNTKLFADIYFACLDSIHAMGDDVKKISWIGQRWHAKPSRPDNVGTSSGCVKKSEKA